MSFPLHSRPRTPGDSTKNNAVGIFQSGQTVPAGRLNCPLWNDVDIYQRIPITFRVQNSTEQICSEISVARTDESSSYLYLRIRMVTKAPFTKLWFPTTNFLGWCVDLHGRFPYTRVADVLIEDCQICTMIAPRELSNFRARLLAFRNVKLIVAGMDDYSQLVEFLKYLQQDN